MRNPEISMQLPVQIEAPISSLPHSLVIYKAPKRSRRIDELHRIMGMREKRVGNQGKRSKQLTSDRLSIQGVVRRLAHMTNEQFEESRAWENDPQIF